LIASAAFLNINNLLIELSIGFQKRGHDLGPSICWFITY